MTNFEIGCFIAMLLGFRSMYTYKRDLEDYKEAKKQGDGVGARYFMSGVILIISSIFILLYFIYRLLMSFVS